VAAGAWVASSMISSRSSSARSAAARRGEQRQLQPGVLEGRQQRLHDAGVGVAVQLQAQPSKGVMMSGPKVMRSTSSASRSTSS
jgi:hypothetical protein